MKRKQQVSPTSGWPWGVHVASVAALIVAVFCLIVPLALGDDFDDFIEALNKLIALEGPVPGSIAKDLPDDLDPKRANTFAYEGGPTGTYRDAYENVDEENFRDPLLDPKFDIPSGAAPSPLFFCYQAVYSETSAPRGVWHSTTAGGERRG